MCLAISGEYPSREQTARKHQQQEGDGGGLAARSPIISFGITALDLARRHGERQDGYSSDDKSAGEGGPSPCYRLEEGVRQPQQQQSPRTQTGSERPGQNSPPVRRRRPP